MKHNIYLTWSWSYSTTSESSNTIIVKVAHAHIFCYLKCHSHSICCPERSNLQRVRLLWIVIIELFTVVTVLLFIVYPPQFHLDDISLVIFVSVCEYERTNLMFFFLTWLGLLVIMQPKSCAFWDILVCFLKKETKKYL